MKTELERFQLSEFSEDYRLNNLFKLIPKHKGSAFDIGTGNAHIYKFLKGIYCPIVLSDISPVIVRKIRKLLKNDSCVKVVIIDISKYVSKIKVDLITAFDVIEHVEEDENALKNIHSSLNQNGNLLLSVPAHPFLFGKRDLKYGHFRRYSKRELHQKLKYAGFSNIRIYYWNLIGVIPYFLFEKVFKKELNSIARKNNKTFLGKATNRLLFIVLSLETKIYTRLPFGLTLIAKASK
ncbi:class I SAM-dependent methyltransferase [Candidatus Woesebacteria bacterium]|nr:MAG: class I SAM-dependent methyltransferase [Candidatus Woesebacteria bacterium]